MRVWILCSFLIIYGLGLQAQNNAIEKFQVQFQIKNAGMTVEGSFAELIAELDFDPNQLDQSQLAGVVQVKSINTGISLRDKHLVGKEYFYADQYPTIQLKSTEFKIIDSKKGDFEGVFLLIIKNKQKSIQIPFSYFNQTYKASFKINRLDFGVGSSSLFLSDEINVEISVYAK